MHSRVLPYLECEKQSVMVAKVVVGLKKQKTTKYVNFILTKLKF